MSVEQVRELIDRAYALPYGEARTVVTEEALRRAEEAGDRRLTFQVRMELGSAYQFGGEPIKTFTTFSRCLAEFDADPGALDADAEHRLLWQFKWIVYSMTQFPEVPLDRTRTVLDDMERRYKLGGHSLHAVYGRRTRVAMHLGDLDDADRWYALWHSAPEDVLSDCEGCDPSGKVSYLNLRGRDEEALALAGPVLSEELTCVEQPQSMLTELIPVYLRAGMHEEARNAHLRAYRIQRARLSELPDIADHVEFCALTGNEARGLEIVQRHLEWLDRAPSPHADMRFSAASALLLRRVEEAGHGGVKLSRPTPAGPEEVAISELREDLTRRALDLGAAFDDRNGTGYQGDGVRATLAAEPVVEHLPLAQYDRRPAAAAVPPPAPEPVPDHSGVDDPDALLDLAEQAWQDRRLPPAVAAWHRFDELSASREPTPVQVARRTDGLGMERIMAGDPDGAAAEWERAARLYADAGDLDARHSALGRVGAVRCNQERFDEGLPLLNEAVAYLDAHAPGSRRAFSARMRLGEALLRDRPAEALAVLDHLTADEPNSRGDLEAARARALLQAGRIDEALPVLDRARSLYEECGDGPSLGDVLLLRGKVLAHLGFQGPEPDPAVLDEAVAALDGAVAKLPADAPMRAVAHLERGTLLMARDRAADAVPDLVEAVAAGTSAGAVPLADQARVELVTAYQATGRHLEAAETAEEVLPAVDGDPDVHFRVRLMLAHAQESLGEAQAADLFAELAKEVGDPHGTAQLLEHSATVLTRLDADADAADRFADAAEAFALAGDAYGVVRARRQGALCRLWAHQGEQGLTDMDGARAALADLPPDPPEPVVWETALVSYDQARLLADAGRPGEALRRVEEAIAGFTELDEVDAAATAARLRDELASALE